MSLKAVREKRQEFLALLPGVLSHTSLQLGQDAGANLPNHLTVDA
jgi:hypothetical protein